MLSALLAVALHGIVLAVNRSTGTAVIKHDAFAGMPTMTMTFALGTSDARRLAIGDDVRGDIDTAREPWRLRITAISAAKHQADTGAQAPVPVLRQGEAFPDAAFVDQLGRDRSWRDFLGHTTVLSFIYTRCRDATMCPLVSAKFEELQRTLPGNARLIEFTLDPAYDVPAVLRRYGEMFAANPAKWTLATGDAEVMRRVAASFGVGISSSEDSSVVHSEVLGIVDSSGNVMQIVPGNTWQPDEVAAVVRAAEGITSDPWERFVLGIHYAARQCGLGNMSLAHAAEMLFLFACIGSIALLALIIDLFIRLRRGSAGSQPR